MTLAEGPSNSPRARCQGSPHTSGRREAQAQPKGIYSLTKDHKSKASNNGNGVSSSSGGQKSRPGCLLRAVRENAFQAIPASGGC